MADTPRIRTGGVMRCCMAGEIPQHANEGDTVPCVYCLDGGLRLVTRADGQHWEAAWLTLGHDWRKAA